MHKVEIDRGHILRLGIEGQIGVQRIAGLEHEQLPRIDMCRGLDGVVIAVEAVRVVLAVLPDFAITTGAGSLTSLVSADAAPQVPIKSNATAGNLTRADFFQMSPYVMDAIHVDEGLPGVLR